MRRELARLQGDLARLRLSMAQHLCASDHLTAIETCSFCSLSTNVIGRVKYGVDKDCCTWPGNKDRNFPTECIVITR